MECPYSHLSGSKCDHFVVKGGETCTAEFNTIQYNTILQIANSMTPTNVDLGQIWTNCDLNGWWLVAWLHLHEANSGNGNFSSFYRYNHHGIVIIIITRSDITPCSIKHRKRGPSPIHLVSRNIYIETACKMMHKRCRIYGTLWNRYFDINIYELCMFDIWHFYM